jgi:amino acid transporter
VGLVLPLWLGFQYDPITAFSLLATILVIVVISIYMVVNLSCIAYHYRFRRTEANPVVHAVVPALGIVAFVPALLTAAGVPVFAFIARLPHPLSLSGPVAGLWMLLGVGYLARLAARDPQRIRDTGKVFLEEELTGT